MATCQTRLSDGNLPEWPFGFEGAAEDRLNNDEIGALFLGRALKGEQHAGGRFEMTTDADGYYSFQAGSGTSSGRISIEDGALASSIPSERT